MTELDHNAAAQAVRDFCAARNISYDADVVLKDYTTFQIGGRCALMASPCSAEEIAALVRFCREGQVPYTVVGRGSNLLVSDEGVEGIIIRLGKRLSGLKLLSDGVVECAAGVSLARLCAFAQENGLSGLEFAWGIPGSAGGAVYMNAGAYGGEMKDVLLQASHVTDDGQVGTLPSEELMLGYRRSFYTGKEYVITSLQVGLHPDDPQAIRARMDDYMQRRMSKQPLEYPSAGSVFKRPEGNYAGKLIQDCGLKGYRIGGAMVSDKHSGFIINVGNATCADVQALIRHIQETVAQQTGYRLECEVKMI